MMAGMRLVPEQGSREVCEPEVRPQDAREEELCMRALRHSKVRKAVFARCADEQIYRDKAGVVGIVGIWV